MNVVDRISLELKLDPIYISRIADRASYYYKDFVIPKKNGGKRYISQPSPELKTLQYWILHNILKELPISKAACAYQKGNSIKKHAEMHRESRHILHADISNFFPSIHSSHLIQILKNNKDVFDKLNLDFKESVNDIGKICFRNDRLCIGAVSSPAISNIIMCSFDGMLLNYCKSHNYIYSRYADDICISSKSYIENSEIKFLREQLYMRGFKINTRKTRFYSSKYRRKITGLIVTNNSQISIGTKQRNNIKRMIYDKLVNGIGDSNQILGYLSFLKDVEPNTYNNLIIKYSRYCEGDIITALRK